MPFIIWGSKGVTNTTGGGQFHCPTCGPNTYTQKKVQRYFTLYWIPLFPLNTLGEYVECDICAQGYDPAILDYDPSNSPEVVLSKVHVAATRLMAAMVLADGSVEAEELQAMVEASAKLPGGPITLADAQAAVDEAQSSPISPVHVVNDVVDLLNDQGKELLMYVAYHIAASDGDVADEEKLLLLEMGEALGLDVTDRLAQA